MARLIVCRNCTESDCTYCNMNILAVALERGYFNSLMREQHTVQIDSELVPVRHRHWEYKHLWKGVEAKYCECSACHHPAWWPTDYCPNCGAKMDEVET